MNVTDLEIEEAIREAWTILHAGGASPSARRLAAALLAVTGGTPAHPHWVTPDDLWRDRLAVLAEQDAWLVAWGPRPGEPDCRVPPALLPENQTRRENAYLLWRSTVRVSTDADARAGQCISRDPDAGMTSNNPARPARGRGGANHPHPSSNPVAARIECLRTCPTAPCPSHYLNPAASARLMGSEVAARFRRLVEPPALIHSAAAPCHHRPFLRPLPNFR